MRRRSRKDGDKSPSAAGDGCQISQIVSLKIERFSAVSERTPDAQFL